MNSSPESRGESPKPLEYESLPAGLPPNPSDEPTAPIPQFPLVRPPRGYSIDPLPNPFAGREYRNDTKLSALEPEESLSARLSELEAKRNKLAAPLPLSDVDLPLTQRGREILRDRRRSRVARYISAPLMMAKGVLRATFYSPGGKMARHPRNPHKHIV